MIFAIRAATGIAIAAVVATQVLAAGAGLPSYKIVKTVKLGAPDKWDFLYFDPSAKLVYISHRTKVDVVDPMAGKVVGELAPVGESHGVAALPKLGRIYAGDAKANVLIAADARTFSKAGSAPVGIDSDAVIADPAAARVYVMNGDGQSVTAVDAAKNKALKTVALGGSPEFAAIDGKGRLFINIADTNEIAVFDTNKLSVAARWPTAPCEKPHGMAMDLDTDLLFVSCGNARMIVVNAANGAIVANLPIGKGTDAAAFDPVRKLAFSSNGEGTLSVIAERGPDDFVSLGEIKTAPGARTMALDPNTGRIFLVTGNVTKTELSHEPGHGPHFVFAPGSVKLLVLEPIK
jgi:YVTN family beta-propeller protein